eukprot:CAMPEP_0168746254 /NCGR_PEP_ID=MMETSP0724-20121128/15049_1 /TAXON_ID=265536 /ORGANISM="Amphiprora sp., Strain CCMP467" /LENGTH=327 /DNA_ID=CAMNT_0008794013 /DNA_START=177 /DNA_END=1160 /DNA_ORIENTATION=-
MSTNLNYKQVANVERRTWDLEAYEKKARQRQQALDEQQQQEQQQPEPGRRKTTKPTGNDTTDTTTTTTSIVVDKEEFRPALSGAAGPEGSDRAFLQARKARRVADLDSRVGTIELVSADAAATTKLGDDTALTSGAIIDNADPTRGVVTKTGIGWHCRVCDCFLKDSHTYLDHINGRKHQRKLGFSMRVERSTQDDLQATLRQLQQQQQQQTLAKDQNDDDDEPVDFARLVRAKDDELERKRAERKKKRQERKRQWQLERAGPTAPQRPSREEEDGQKGTTNDSHHPKPNDQQRPTTETETEETEPEIDPNLAAMMGFSGFGGSGKN